MHGGTNPGAPKGNSNRLVHGLRSRAYVDAMAEARAFLREARLAID